MKKRICGFRQKLGIILAAGMIVSNMNFAVLPVSATDGVENPPVEEAFSADAVLEMLELIESASFARADYGCRSSPGRFQWNLGTVQFNH